MGWWRARKTDPVKPVKCKCPKCEKIHTQNMFWTGGVMPRISCEDCRKSKYRIIVPEGYEIYTPTHAVSKKYRSHS